MPTVSKMKKSSRRSSPFMVVAAFALLAAAGAVALPLQAQLMKVFSAQQVATTSMPAAASSSSAVPAAATVCWAPLKSDVCVRVPVSLEPAATCLTYGLVDFEAQCMEALQRP